jgi:RHS repeat-associated protein
MYYVHTDHLGSVHEVTGSTGGVVQELSYDAWGRQRNATDWTYSSLPVPKFERGFTFHEQLADFELVNMNGRMYDPVVGKFLSPDPVLQFPDNLQNYNRYSYVLNNPLKYTDPGGYKARKAEMLYMDWNDGWWSVLGRYGGGNSSTFFLGSSSGGGSGGGFGGGGYSSSWYMGTMYNPDGSINYPGPSSGTVDAWFDSGLNSLMSLGDFDRYYSAGVPIRTINESRQLDWIRRNGERYLRGVRLTYSETWTSTSAKNEGGSSLPSWPSWINNIVGTAAYGVYEADGSMRFMKGGSLSLKYYASAWTGGSRARITTYNLTKLGTGVGYGTSVFGFFIGGYNFAVSDKSWGDYGALGISILSSGLTLSGYTAPIGIGIGFIDVAGGFNGFYNYLDTQQQFYNGTGGVMLPVNGIPTFIPLRRP